MGKLVVTVSAFVCLLATIARQSDGGTLLDNIDEELESERQLKHMMTYVTPLMAIVRSDERVVKRAVRSDGRYEPLDDERDFVRLRNGPVSKNGYGGGGGGYGGYQQQSYYYPSCCQKKDDLLPLLALLGLAGLLLYLVAIASKTTTAAGGRRKRSEDDNELNDDIVLLDGPTWLSMVHELWEQDGALANTACTQETLCRMNRLAMAAPGQAGWAVSMSSLPLSYLLHSRHSEGFTSYMDAALMGRSGANCTELYSACPRLSYYK